MNKKQHNGIFKGSPEDTVPPFMRIRQYVASLLMQSEGENVKLLSERELSSLFKVTRPTVRKALKQLIEEGDLIIKPGLGTYVNPLRNRNTRTRLKKSLKICVIYGNGRITHWDAFFWEIFKECGTVLTQNNVLIHFLNLTYSGEKAGDEISIYQPDGILWIMPPDSCLEALQTLKKKEIPVMLVNRDFPDLKIDSVRQDYKTLGFMAGQYMVRENYKRVLYAAKRNHWPYNLIYIGFKQAYRKAGKTYNEKYALDDKDDIYREVTGFFRYGDGISAVFSLTTFIDVVCEAILDSGQKLNELSILTQDSPALNFIPDLHATIIKEPLAEIGRTAAEKLLHKLKTGKSNPIQICLKPQLINE